MISIVIPVYNAEKYLNKCIDSILTQTYISWELVLVDNGSTDNSMDICRQYAAQDSRITAIHQYQNKGVSGARNLGMERCSGEFVTFIDADDWVRQDYLETLYKLQKSESADMVVCEYNLVYEEDRVKNETDEWEKEAHLYKIYDTKDYWEHYLLEGNPHCWGILYKNSILDQLKFPVGITIGEDLLFILEASLKAEKIVLSKYKGYRYYINTSGAMLKKFTPTFMDQILCWQKAKAKIEEIYPELNFKVESILVVSILVVVGKISELTREEQENYQSEIQECYQVFMQYGKKKEIQKYFPEGYKLKVLLYRYFPKLYIFLYGNLKNKVIWWEKE